MSVGKNRRRAFPTEEVVRAKGQREEQLVWEQVEVHQGWILWCLREEMVDGEGGLHCGGLECQSKVPRLYPEGCGETRKNVGEVRIPWDTCPQGQPL